MGAALDDRVSEIAVFGREAKSLGFSGGKSSLWVRCRRFGESGFRHSEVGREVRKSGR
jgi:hypothetical protein